MEPRVIFEDSEVLVLDKPAGMIVNRSDTTVGEKTVQEWVEGYLKVSKVSEVPKVSKGVRSPFDTFDTFPTFDTFLQRAGIIHRLDKGTSGILLVAKTKEAFENLQKQFKERKVKKTYQALVHGEVKIPEGEINVPVGRLPWNRKKFGVMAEGREAVTKYRVLNLYNVILRVSEGSHEILRHSPQNDRGAHDINNEQLTLLEMYPETGRTHQIRVHLKYFGHPIFADPLYGGRKTARNDRKLLSRIFLHAGKISFYHPKDGELVSFESHLPEQLSQFLTTLNS
jgi:23S rRNA pseudouridine1911/1915/1917 synthase